VSKRSPRVATMGDDRMTQPTPRQLVVSLHDVSPSRLMEVRHLLAELDRLGARPRVLKVIPAEPGATPRDYGPLYDLLRSEQEAGSEIVLHGHTHRSAGRPAGPAVDAVRARFFAPHVAEFMCVEPDEARRRLAAGRSELRGAGLDVRGFCAPAWLAQPWLTGTLRELGFQHYVGMAQLVDLRGSRRLWLPWAGYVGGGSAHEILIRFGSAALLAASAGRPVVKVFLHPAPQPSVPALRRPLAIVSKLLRTRRPTTYAALLG
jgi:predicted deacetylase